MKKDSSNLILIGIFAGIVLGLLIGGFLPNVGKHFGFLGDIFIHSLMLMVVPLVMASMIVGIARLGDVRNLGSIGGKTVAYFLITTGIAVVIGLILVNTINPGKGMRGEEIYPDAAYVIEGKKILLQGDAGLGRTEFDERYIVTLEDQKIYGSIDKGTPVTQKEIAVSEWMKEVWLPTWEAASVLNISMDEMRNRIRDKRLQEKFENGRRLVLVSASEDAEGRSITPAPGGSGIKISLPIAKKVEGKEKTIFAVLTEVVVGLVPTNLFKAMVEMDVLPIIIFSLLFGGVLTTLGDIGKPVITLFEGVNEAIMKIVHLIMWFAPVGIFALLAARLGNAGGWVGFMPELIKLGKYAGCVVLGLIIHGFIILPLILKYFAKRPVIQFIKNTLEALVTAFSTASSSATLPVTMECAEEKNNISNRTASFVIPLGATVNMNGTALYEAVAAMFVAQVYGIEMSLAHQGIIFLTATLAAIGAAGIPEAGLVTMVIVMKAVKLPIEGITLILVIDWLLDRCRTTINVWGDVVGAAVIERYEKESLPPEAEY